MFIRTLIRHSAVGLLLGLLPPILPAHASPTYAYSLHLTGLVNQSDSTDTLLSLDGATASIGYSPTLSLSAFSASSSEAAQATATYHFAVSGPSTGIAVPVDITWSASATSATGAVASEYLYVNGTYLSDEASANAVRGGTYSGGGTYSMTASTGTNVGFLLLASATGSINGSASAFVDPYITIDPSFFTNNPSYTPSQFSITFDDPLVQNTGAPSPAPEPSSLMTIASGIVVAGLLHRRQKRAVSRTS